MEPLQVLFYNLSVICDDISNGLPQRNISHEMMDHPTIDETRKTIKEINTGKAPGLDGIPVEVLRWGGDKIPAKGHRLISNVWLGAPVPKDWTGALFISLYTGKGLPSICSNYRGIL